MAAVKSIKSATHAFVKEVKNKKVKGLVEKDASSYVQTKTTQKSKLYATVDGGRLHLGQDEQYVGSIDSYNNFLTKFFANIFGWSTQVTINGKTRHVNKTDYTNWVNNNTAHVGVTRDLVGGYLDINLLDIKKDPSQGRMRDHLSAGKTKTLWEKMVAALADKKDFEAAKKYAGKGANLDDYFYVREGHSISHTTLTDGLEDDKEVDFRAGYYTPLLYAAEKNNKVFCDFVRTLDANTSLKGQYLQFTKKTNDVNQQTNVVSEDVFTGSDNRTITKVTLKTSFVRQIEDQVTPKVDILFNPETSTLSKQESKSPVVIERYSKPIEFYSTIHKERSSMGKGW